MAALPQQPVPPPSLGKLLRQLQEEDGDTAAAAEPGPTAAAGELSTPLPNTPQVITPDSFLRVANQLGLTVGLFALTKEEDPEQFEVLAVSDGMAVLVDALDKEAAVASIKHHASTSMALRAQCAGLSKLLQHGYTHPTAVRRMFFHSDKPAEAYLVWHLPCRVRAKEHVYEQGYICLASDREEGKGGYASLIQEHLGLAFTPAIVSVVDMEGQIIYQNAASMAALGIQGLKHRAPGSPPSLNLLEELFIAEPEALQEMREVAHPSALFSRFIKIRSKELQRWLGCSSDTWHQVQVSHTICPETLQHLFVVAQVDVTADMLAQHRLAVLQAENMDLHSTTAWLEEQKEKVQETNLRLKESLVEALAARDRSLECEDTCIDIDSPTDKAIQLLNKFLEGQEVSVREVLAVRDVLLAAGPDDFLQPVNFREQMDAQMTSTMDEEVGRSLMDMLVPSRPLSISRPTGRASFTCTDLTRKERGDGIYDPQATRLGISHSPPTFGGLPCAPNSKAKELEGPARGMGGVSFLGEMGTFSRKGLLGRSKSSRTASCTGSSSYHSRSESGSGHSRSNSSMGHADSGADATPLSGSSSTLCGGSAQGTGSGGVAGGGGVGSGSSGGVKGLPLLSFLNFRKSKRVGRSGSAAAPGGAHAQGSVGVQQGAAEEMGAGYSSLPTSPPVGQVECYGRQGRGQGHALGHGQAHMGHVGEGGVAGGMALGAQASSGGLGSGGLGGVGSDPGPSGVPAGGGVSQGSPRQQQAAAATHAQAHAHSHVPLPHEHPHLHPLHQHYHTPHAVAAHHFSARSGLPHLSVQLPMTMDTSPETTTSSHAHSRPPLCSHPHAHPHTQIAPKQITSAPATCRAVGTTGAQSTTSKGGVPIVGASLSAGEEWDEESMEGDDAAGPPLSTVAVSTSPARSVGKVGTELLALHHQRRAAAAAAAAVSPAAAPSRHGPHHAHAHAPPAHTRSAHSSPRGAAACAGAVRPGRAGGALAPPGMLAPSVAGATQGHTYSVAIMPPMLQHQAQGAACARAAGTAGSVRSMRSSSGTGEECDTEDSVLAGLPGSAARHSHQACGPSCPTCHSLGSKSLRRNRATSDSTRNHGSSAPAKHIAAMIHLWRNPPDHIARVLAAADDWSWDAFELNDATNGRPLSTLAFALLTKHYGEELRSCCVDETRLARFLMRIEDGYLDNPYHNRVHATDVLQWTHMLMRRGGVLSTLQVCDASALATILSAVVHDVGHKGLNNDFLIRSGDNLALLYNDISPMENFHLAATFQLMANDHFNFLARSPKEVRDTIRKQIITMVLATDMKQHFSHTSLFKSKVGASAHDDEGAGPGHPAGMPSQPEQQEPPATIAAAVTAQDDELKSLALAVALKCADLGNLAAPNPVHRRWVAQLEEEYFQQGDREKVNGMQVSPLMDRLKAGVSKSQPGFFSIVGRPLFKTFTQAFPASRPILDGANANFAYWKRVEEEKTQHQPGHA